MELNDFSEPPLARPVGPGGEHFRLSTRVFQRCDALKRDNAETCHHVPGRAGMSGVRVDLSIWQIEPKGTFGRAPGRTCRSTVTRIDKSKPRAHSGARVKRMKFIRLFGVPHNRRWKRADRENEENEPERAFSPVVRYVEQPDSPLTGVFRLS